MGLELGLAGSASDPAAPADALVFEDVGEAGAAEREAKIYLQNTHGVNRNKTQD